MDTYEATRIVLSRIQNLDPENAYKIMGLLLIQDHDDKEMIRLAFGPEDLVHSVILKARKDLGLTSSNTPSTPFIKYSRPGVLGGLPMGRFPDAFVSGSDTKMDLSWHLYWAFHDPDSPQRKALDELILQKLPVNNLPSDNITSLLDECVGMIWKNMMSGDPTWDRFRESDEERGWQLKTMVQNSLFAALSRDYPHRENIPSLVRQFSDILRQKLQCNVLTGEDCPHDENISSPIHPCADTTPQNSQSSESAGVRVYERNKSSVVRIDTILRRVNALTLDVLEVPQELGSGIVWDKRGHVLTNYHVIRCGLTIHSHVRVKLADQSTYVAKVVFVDPDNDVAGLRINAPKHKLIPIRFGNLADLRVGEKVYAFGNPFGFNRSLTKGVISALHREINSVNTGCPMQDMIQTDAAINPGNSGGALLDRFGNFIGMNTSISSRCRESCGVGFAIPVDKLRRIFYDCMKQNVGTNLAPDQFVEQVGVSGVPVLDAPVKSPASNVGLEVIKQKIMALLGDIVTFMKETKVPNQSDLYSTLGHSKMGVKMFPGMEQHGSAILLARDVCAS